MSTTRACGGNYRRWMWHILHFYSLHGYDITSDPTIIIPGSSPEGRVPRSDPFMNCKVSRDHFKMQQLHITQRSSSVMGGTAAQHTVKSAQMFLFSFLVCIFLSAPRYLSESECVVSNFQSTCREDKQVDR